MQSSDWETKKLHDKYWESIKDQGPLAGITLDPNITPEDFKTYGDRLALRQVAMFDRHNHVPFDGATIVDVGCGMGRTMRPYSMIFQSVIGTDISLEILDQAKKYCSDRSNIEYIHGDGHVIPVADSSVDFVYSGGVLQHIPSLDVILNYFKEGIRILKPGGILNYSFQTWYTSREGGVDGNRVGAQITASDIHLALMGLNFEVLSIVVDPKDPIPHMNLLLRKTEGPVNSRKQKLRRRKVHHQDVRTGIFEDLESYTDFRNRWRKRKPHPVTFWR